MITRLTMKGWGGIHADTVINFGHPLTVFVGPNGSGKGSALEAIRQRMAFPDNIQVEMDGRGAEIYVHSGGKLGPWEKTGLASLDSKRREALVADMSEVFPQTELSFDGIHLCVKTKGSERTTLPNLSGDGYPTVLSLLAALYLGASFRGGLAARPCMVVLIDQLERNLHPLTQMRLMALLSRLLGSPWLAHLQIVATSHSPYLIDKVAAWQVQVFALRPDGTAAVKPLCEHPDYEGTRGALSAGELWSTMDEAKWVCGEK